MAFLPMRTVSPATFSNGVGVLPTGPKLEPFWIRTSSRTLMMDWVAPVTSTVAFLPARIWHTLYVPGSRLRLAPLPSVT